MFACMRIIIKYTRDCGQLSSNDTLFSNRWFVGVKIVEEGNSEGVYYCGPVKISHKEIFLAMLEKIMKEW